MQYSTWKRSVFSYWLIAFFVVSLSLLKAQTLRYSFHSLTTEDGLSQASNDFVYHDSKGFIWLSSLDGLNRYDGQTVKTYKYIPGDSTSLLDNIITSNFFEDAQSNLWFTTYEGIHCYLRERDHFRHFQLRDPDGQLRQQDYHAFFLDTGGRLWVRIGIDGSGHLHRFDIQSLEQEILGPLDGQRNYPLTDEQGQVRQIISSLFSQKRGLEIRSVATPMETRSFLDGHAGQPKVFVHQALAGNNKELYLATDQGLFLFDLTDQSLKQFTVYKDSLIGKVYGLCRMNDSLLWVTTRQQSVLQFNQVQQQFSGQIPIDPDAALGLHLQSANKVYLDPQQNLWLSSFSGGVQFANLQKRKFQLLEPFVGQPVFQIFEEKNGHIYISYGGSALAQFDPATESFSPVPLNLSATKLEGIQFFLEGEDGRLQGLTSNHRLLRNPTDGSFDYAGPLPGTILYFYQTPSGTKLLSTYIGLFEWKDGTFLPFNGIEHPEQLLATAIYQDKSGRLYFALDASQLKIFEETGSGYKAIHQIDGIGYAKAFYETDTVLWVA
ncbi:MAG: hypothetical protein KDC44_19040, partial [Phaeodactylibacter sp.]|nr:hypothetical protein [Phaeodactylibacter sp.]